VVRAASSWPIDAVREQVHRSIDVVVHVERTSDGVRRIGDVAEVASASVAMPAARTLLLADADRVVAEPQRWRR
jgi:Flp pilus assembly CpaF family ATPase